MPPEVAQRSPSRQSLSSEHVNASPPHPARFRMDKHQRAQNQCMTWDHQNRRERGRLISFCGNIPDLGTTWMSLSLCQIHLPDKMYCNLGAPTEEASLFLWVHRLQRRERISVAGYDGVLSTADGHPNQPMLVRAKDRNPAFPESVDDTPVGMAKAIVFSDTHHDQVRLGRIQQPR